MKVRIFCVGGTIDKVYFDAKSKYEVGEPAVRQILRRRDPGYAIEVTSLMAKDSLDMSDKDRDAILQAVEACEENRIVVTHGTDTMVATAEVLAVVTHKTIVLTGALAPAIFRDSDAEFNLGGALAVAQVAEPGVYIVMNGEVFDAAKVEKDVENNRFRRTE